ncbi:MAG: RNA polymerase sigma factor SigM [Propionibacteriales bacterium]|nr:RNA polymerase sigma factor SigM [Propionibacteriales bacterium]
MTDDDLSDETLLSRHVAGDPDAFGVLFARHRDRLWAIALRTLGNREDAADALQDAMISAFRRAEGFRGGSAVTTWLHRIVVNACLDHVRRAKVRSADPLPEDPERVTALAAQTQPDPVDQLTDRGAVLAALRTLPEDQRAALVLVDMEGYSVAEAAQMLDCAPGTIKSRCARGRARLHPHLADLRNQAEPARVEPLSAPHEPMGGDGS